MHVWNGRDAAFLNVTNSFISRALGVGRQGTDAVEILFRSSSRAEEIRNLRIEHKAFAARIVLLEDTKRENEELRAALGRETTDMQFMYAHIIGQSPSLIDDYLLVDAGAVEGVEVDMLVLVGGIIHIGSITQVAKHSAVVKLISHTDEKIHVYLPEADVSSVAVGKGAGVLEIQVPASILVREGEPLLSVGPPDFLVGYVEKVEKSDAGPFQIVRTGHPMTLADLRRVFLVQPLTHVSR